MKKTRILVYVVAFMLVLGLSAYAAPTQTSFRCGNWSVKPGDDSIALLASCGEPIVKEDLGARGRGRGKNVERWVYGPRAGYYYVIMIEGGKVVSVEAIRNN